MKTAEEVLRETGKGFLTKAIIITAMKEYARQHSEATAIRACGTAEIVDEFTSFSYISDDSIMEAHRQAKFE